MQALSNHEIPGHVSVFAGKGGLPAIRVESALSTAEIYQHGAHVTSFCRKGESPLLFMSAASDFHAEKPIRGGVPLIFPNFGAHEGQPFHGIARLSDWELTETLILPDGSIRLAFKLPVDDGYLTEYLVTVGSSLTLELIVTNTGDSPFTFENCLHTYFQIGDIKQAKVAGLQGARYRDQLLAEEFTESADSISFAAETDRVYLNTAATVEIIDPALARSIFVRKSGSQSTVVWNPWIEKSQRMPDFGDEEYHHMVCVESGNVRENAITLAPGERSVMRVEIDSAPL